jgi:hypothetical protein
MGYTISWRQKPFTKYSYNNVIKLTPKVINPNMKLRVEPWGIVIGSGDETFPISKENTWLNFDKTNREPYTKDCMKLLIVMVEFGACEDLDHDDTDMSLYLEALEEVNAIHPLFSYELQKDYFMQKKKENV